MSRLNKWEAYQALKNGKIVVFKSDIGDKYYYKMIGGQIYCSGSQYFEDYTDDHRMFPNMENKFEIVEDDKEQEIKHLKTIVNLWDNEYLSEQAQCIQELVKWGKYRLKKLESR